MSEPLPLDEEDENYGYGIFNVHTNEFVKQLGECADPHIYGTSRKAVKFMLDMVFDRGLINRDQLSAYRVVRVHLDNEVDEKLAKAVKMYANSVEEDRPNAVVIDDVLDSLFDAEGGEE